LCKKFVGLHVLFHDPVNCGGLLRFDWFQKKFVYLQELTRSFRKELSQNGSVSLARDIVEPIPHQKEYFVLGCQGRGFFGILQRPHGTVKEFLDRRFQDILDYYTVQTESSMHVCPQF